MANSSLHRLDSRVSDKRKLGKKIGSGSFDCRHNLCHFPPPANQVPTLPVTCISRGRLSTGEEVATKLEYTPSEEPSNRHPKSRALLAGGLGVHFI